MNKCLIIETNPHPKTMFEWCSSDTKDEISHIKWIYNVP
jgi:hypothetical protein